MPLYCACKANIFPALLSNTLFYRYFKQIESASLLYSCAHKRYIASPQKIWSPIQKLIYISRNLAPQLAFRPKIEQILSLIRALKPNFLADEADF